MALAVVVDGPALIKTGTGSADALESLGYSIDGIQIAENGYFDDVPGDQNGGTAGPPIDVQYMGEIHRIRMELSKWDIAVAAKLFPKLKGGTAGVIGTPGTLIAGSSSYYRLLIVPTSNPRNYLAAIPRGAIEINKGTRFSRLVLDFECHAFSGTLYNETTT